MSKFNLTEGLGYKDLAGMMKSTVYIDDFSSKMGDDDEIIVASFYVRDRQAAVDLINWFEKGYDFVLDADMSPGEVKPNRFLVYVELKRRNYTGDNIASLLDDFNTLTEYEGDGWTTLWQRNAIVETFNQLNNAKPINVKSLNSTKQELPPAFLQRLYTTKAKKPKIYRTY